MKIRALAALCLLFPVVFSGCKGFWNPPPRSCTGSNCSTSSGVFYVLNEGTGQIVADSISSSGISNINSYSLAGLTALAVAPGGKYFYASIPGSIYLYTVGSGGALTIANNGQAIYSYAGLETPAAMVVTGSWLVDAFSVATGSVEIDAIPIDTSTGLSTATANNPAPSMQANIAGASAIQMALSPDGTNLFVALQSGGTIVVPFTASSANPLGSYRLIPLLNSAGGALSVAVDPSNRAFYVGETQANSTSNSGGLRVFDYSSLGTGNPRSAPTQTTSIGSGGLSPHAILALASYVYVANGQGSNAGNINWFLFNSSGDTVTAGGNYPAGVQPMGLAEDSTGTYILAVSAGYGTVAANPDLESFTIGSSGALTSFKSSTTGTDPVGAAAIAALP